MQIQQLDTAAALYTAEEEHLGTWFGYNIYNILHTENTHKSVCVCVFHSIELLKRVLALGGNHFPYPSFW